MLAIYSETYRWFREAIPNPTEANRKRQLDCIEEEVNEFIEAETREDVLDALCDITVTCLGLLYMLNDYATFSLIEDEDDVHVDSIANYKTASLTVMERLKEEFKIIDTFKLRDSLATMIYLCEECAMVHLFTFSGAMAEVNRSNFSKFENGRPVFDKTGKIKKGRDYSKPSLEKFI